jgi:hypothetical protein
MAAALFGVVTGRSISLGLTNHTQRRKRVQRIERVQRVVHRRTKRDRRRAITQPLSIGLSSSFTGKTATLEESEHDASSFF